MFMKLKKPFDQCNKTDNDKQIKTIVLDGGLETRFVWNQYQQKIAFLETEIRKNPMTKKILGGRHGQF